MRIYKKEEIERPKNTRKSVFALALVCVVPVSSKTSFFFAVSSSVGAIGNRLRKEPDVCSKPTNSFAV